MNTFTDAIREELNFLAYVPILFISAKTGQRVDQVMPMALQVQEERLARLTTSQLNSICKRLRISTLPLPTVAARCAFITGLRFAVTRPPFCCMSTIQTSRISPMCVFWKIQFARNTISLARPSALLCGRGANPYNGRHL